MYMSPYFPALHTRATNPCPTPRPQPSIPTPPRSGIDSLHADHPNQPLDPLSMHPPPLAGQPLGHPPAAVERAGGLLFVDQSHQPQILGSRAGRLVVEGRAVQPQQLALSAD